MIDKLQQQSMAVTQQIIFFVTERLAHACLHLDPGTRARLSALSGKCLRFHIRDALPCYRDGIVVFVFPTAKGFELTADASKAVADVSVSLAAKELLALLCNRPMPPDAVAIDGDHALLATVLDIVKGFDIDWEKAIAPVTGDILAHQVGKNMRATEKWLSQSFCEAKRLAEEYLTEEFPVARQSTALKPVFDNLDKMKAAGDAMRDRLADVAAKSSFFKPGK